MYNQLTSEQRYFIEVSLQNGMSKKMIAESLKVHLSTVYREISRNKGVHSYHHKLAQQKCDERKHRMRAIRTFTLDLRKRIFTLLVDEQWSPEQIKGKNAKALARTVVSQLLPYKKHVLTITTDNGSEFADFKCIEKWLDTQVFFTHPYSSWEKGAIENANGLIRQYLPKGLDFNEISDSNIQQVQFKINRRPRKKLQFESPKSAFFRRL